MQHYIIPCKDENIPCLSVDLVLAVYQSCPHGIRRGSRDRGLIVILLIRRRVTARFVPHDALLRSSLLDRGGHSIPANSNAENTADAAEDQGDDAAGCESDKEYGVSDSGGGVIDKGGVTYPGGRVAGGWFSPVRSR